MAWGQLHSSSTYFILATAVWEILSVLTIISESWNRSWWNSCLPSKAHIGIHNEFHRYQSKGSFTTSQVCNFKTHDCKLRRFVLFSNISTTILDSGRFFHNICQQENTSFIYHCKKLSSKIDKLTSDKPIKVLCFDCMHHWIQVALTLNHRIYGPTAIPSKRIKNPEVPRIHEWQILHILGEVTDRQCCLCRLKWHMLSHRRSDSQSKLVGNQPQF